MTRVKFLRLWSVGCGAMDALTGLWLIVAPAGVLHVLGIAPPPADAMVFLSWIGVFVLSVGLSYVMALGNRGRGEATWMFTAVTRLLVAAFLTIKMLDKSLPGPWAMVAMSDATVAVIQLAVLRAGWWKEVPR